MINDKLKKKNVDVEEYVKRGLVDEFVKEWKDKR
jgi:hypothetical protein